MENNKPIRVLQMIASLYLGGSQSVVMNLYRNIDRSKVQFDFIVDHPEYDYYRKEIEELGGKIYVMPTFKGKNIIEVKKAWDDFFTNHPEYKILHSHSRSYASIYFPIAKKHGVKTIIHSHATGNDDHDIKLLIKKGMQFPLRYQADYFMACSKEAGTWLFGNKVIHSDKFYLLKNAIDTKKFEYNIDIRNKYRKEFGIKDDENIYIQVGALTVAKNVLFTLDAFKKLLELKPNSKLFIVGKGEMQDAIAVKIKELNLEDSVMMLGQRGDVNCLLQMADYYLMPSMSEGISLAAIEAQASGIQCILSIGISKDTQLTNNCMFLPLDIETWANEMNKKVLTRKDTTDDIVKNGYDIKTTSNWLCNFYERLANE